MTTTNTVWSMLPDNPYHGHSQKSCQKGNLQTQGGNHRDLRATLVEESHLSEGSIFCNLNTLWEREKCLFMDSLQRLKEALHTYQSALDSCAFVLPFLCPSKHFSSKYL